MKLPSIVKDVQKFLDSNSPVILTGLAIVGVGATAVLTHKAAVNSHVEIEAANLDKRAATKTENVSGINLGTAEKVQLVWKNYVPPVAVGVGTAACMFTATRIQLRRTAAVAAVLALTDGNAKEYKAKAEELLGKTKSQKVKDEISQDYVTENPPQPNQVIITGKGEDLCLDKHTGRYFKSSIEELKHAQNRLNHKINKEGEASLSDFYSFVGLEETQFSDSVGWNQLELLELEFSSVLDPDGVPVLAFEYNVVPSQDYDRVAG